MVLSIWSNTCVRLKIILSSFPMVMLRKLRIFDPFFTEACALPSMRMRTVDNWELGQEGGGGWGYMEDHWLGGFVLVCEYGTYISDFADKRDRFGFH